ncbi:hypothetical protein D8674_011613 [Pyrus ussuriensis x Pyrus communis]|uniref:Uncharacterized protein n=1 Tax=Pyrus ussuriensis x Pyrus communis TaxID=2448454 RepID=A0A5N5FZ84_9ROSA|nr:hypothetical protein D8674_011613 [Pyrus ussuriensis x Pyrus communis]
MSTLIGQVSPLAQGTQNLKVSTQAFMNKTDHSFLPSQVVVNLKDLNNVQVNVITLRNGNELKSTKEPQQIDELSVVQQEEGKDYHELNSNPKVERYAPPMPYPRRFVNSKEQLEKKFLETIKNLEIAIPFFKAIKHIPSYAKFIKELCTNKRMVELNAMVAFSEKVSSVLQRKLPPRRRILEALPFHAKLVQ